MIVGTPDAGTTQASGSSVDSSNYATYEEMVEAYRADIESIEAGDAYGNNLVELYNPLNYIGTDGTEKPHLGENPLRCGRGRHFHVQLPESSDCHA